jgi:hypothetical protein
MSRRVKSVARVFLAIAFGLIMSMTLGLVVCYFGGEHACNDLIWPATMVLGTGFEGQLMAFAATLLFLAAPLMFGIWFVMDRWGPLRDSDSNFPR